MKKLSQQFRTITLTAGLALFAAVPATADDTEVYLGASSTPSDVRPNLVFIIDTSGSMSTNVTSTTTAGTYDPATTYTGACDATRVYWSDSGTVPKCSTTSNYISASSNTCGDSTTALGSSGSGYYVGRFAQYYKKSKKYQWTTLNNGKHTEKIECQADWGVHGESSATNPYPANAANGGPWRANDTNAINWNSVGGNYTVYGANYLNWRESSTSTVTKTRLQIVKDVFGNLMDSISNINVAVMRFDDASTTSNHGGYFIAPMQELNDTTRASYKTAVNGLTANGYTPLAETLYEAYLFYRGDAVLFGDESTPGTNVAGVLDSSDTSKYDSPIEYQCQKNFVILLTDGDPTYDTDANSAIQGLSGFSTVTGSATCTGNCLDELAQYMYTKDCSTLHDDKQNVITYTIGFQTAQTLLSSAASNGGGKYYTADDTAGLTDAFTQILTEILAINTTFIAPAVSVNAFNRFTHRDELYYAVFRPAATPNWDGNVKRYWLTGSPPEIKDKNGDLAIDNNTGFFKTTSTSFWTSGDDAPDGDTVKKGGAASKLTLPRTIYTYTGSTAPSDESLTAASNKLHEDTAAITKTMLGDSSMTDADRTDLLQWARGVDVLDEDSDGFTDDIRRSMGDPLHAKPVLVTYGGDDASPDITLFAGTNEGALHAINPSNGSEVFTFVPQELLPNLKKLYDDSASVAHPYGLDGPLTVWMNDLNDNGVVFDSGGTLETGEHVYLYQGMRRGGSNYYALDVTTRTAPKLKWIIKGGAGGTAGFSELGQTWSAATKAKIKVGGADTTVMIFGGGYDEGQDSNSLAQDDAIGRAIFMVNASTGAKVWQAGPAGSADGADPDLVLADMTNSIPADVRVLDTDGDGYTDRMYAADMRARVWRFDINNSGSTSTVAGGVIATLGGTTEEDNRRFFYSPDVSLSKDRTHINIAIGSGYRAHPLDTTVHDAFFVIHDYDIYGPSTDADGDPVYTAIDFPGDLYDTTSNLIGEGTTAQVDTAKSALAAEKGWYIWLNKSDGSFVGEKVLSKSLTTHDMVMYTTYTPVATASASCSPSQGSARLYQVYIKDGTPVSDFNNSGGSLTRTDREYDLVRGGIPPEPSMIFHENGPVVIVGTEKIPDPGYSLTPRGIYWKIQ
jgi:type IV pilus assembly protein PilY1